MSISKKKNVNAESGATSVAPDLHGAAMTIATNALAMRAKSRGNWLRN